jgi:hypothetical protein
MPMPAAKYKYAHAADELCDSRHLPTDANAMTPPRLQAALTHKCAFVILRRDTCHPLQGQTPLLQTLSLQVARKMLQAAR